MSDLGPHYYEAILLLLTRKHDFFQNKSIPLSPLSINIAQKITKVVVQIQS